MTTKPYTLEEIKELRDTILLYGKGWDYVHSSVTSQKVHDALAQLIERVERLERDASVTSDIVDRADQAASAIAKHLNRPYDKYTTHGEAAFELPALVAQLIEQVEELQKELSRKQGDTAANVVRGYYDQRK